MSRVMIEAVGLHKHFGETHALRGLDLSAAEGTILGVLGPNGAGKTTAVRILTTLTHPDKGEARVAGVDVLREPAEARTKFGVAGQYASLDELLTGRENLEMIGRLYRLPASDVRQRSTELLDRFELTDAGNRPLKTYSGGMRRRLDLGAALMARPPVIFLDEPTTGLDPKGRLSMWDLIADLAKGGTTVLMTTQYLEEADRLADDIAVIDHGVVIARGTADELKRRVGGELLEVVIDDAQFLPSACRALEAISEQKAYVDEAARRVSVPVESHDGVLTRAIRELDGAGVVVDDIGFRRPTLDEVFLAITGRPAEERSEETEEVPA
jgi:ABC-2 type transport system ATP-binding protein